MLTSFGTGEQAGQNFGVRVRGGTRQMAICRNDLITIAAKVAEGNGGRRRTCRFDEDAPAEAGQFQNGTQGGIPPPMFLCKSVQVVCFVALTCIQILGVRNSFGLSGLR